VGKLTAKGKSMGAAGVDLAYRTAAEIFDASAANLVVLVTGGDFDDLWLNQRRGLQAVVERVREQRESGIALKILGVGSQSLDASLLRELSTAGRGKATYADSSQEGRRFFMTELGPRRVVVAHEVLANIEFNPAQVAEYRLIGYETSQSSSWDQRRASYPGATIGSGQEMTILYEITPPDSPARRVLPLRYSRTGSEATPAHANELAYLRLGYRLPGTSRRQSMVQPIFPEDERLDMRSAPSSTRFAIAVAAYAEKLRNDGYIGDDFTFGQILDLARGADGPDPLLLRREFQELVGRAGTLACAASRQLSADCRRKEVN
jgi:Ca-activated chloride channel family protein